jgi:OFA family oxalate/formate antiporter-like MFS transporter
MPPLAASLIEALGWRGAYLVLGGLAAIVGAGMAVMIESDPRACGLGPDGDPLRAGARSVPMGATLSEAIKSRRFIGLYVACLLCSFGVFVPFAHLALYAMDHGVPKSSAVLLVGVIGIGSTAGRFFLGGLTDRVGRRLSLLAMFVGMALAMVIWAISREFWPLAAFAFAYGIFYGGWVALLPALVMDYFGGVQYQRHHRHPLHPRGGRHADRPERRRLRLPQPQYSLPILASVCMNIIAAGIVAATSKASVPTSGPGVGISTRS